MKLNFPLPMAAFGLSFALSAQAANIKISSLPFAMMSAVESKPASKGRIKTSHFFD
jgi:hypothetical protein